MESFTFGLPDPGPEGSGSMELPGSPMRTSNRLRKRVVSLAVECESLDADEFNAVPAARDDSVFHTSLTGPQPASDAPRRASLKSVGDSPARTGRRDSLGLLSLLGMQQPSPGAGGSRRGSHGFRVPSPRAEGSMSHELWSSGAEAPRLCAPAGYDTSRGPSPLGSGRMVLGRGATGTVSATPSENGMGCVAEKRIRVTGGGRARCAATELEVFRRAKSLATGDDDDAPGSIWHDIVHVLDAELDEDGDSAILRMELMDRGPLHLALADLQPSPCRGLPSTSLPPAPDAALATVARRLCEAMETIHLQLRVLHRDLKPANILVGACGEIKLCDFGLAALFSFPGPPPASHKDADSCESLQELAEDQCGTAAYMSPERLRGEVHGTPSDVWSVGVLLLELALGRHPFVDVGAPHDRYWQVASAIRSTEDAATCEAATAALVEARLNEARASAGLTRFIHATVVADPKGRSRAAQLLEDQWLANAATVLPCTLHQQE